MTHGAALIDPQAQVDASARIGPFAVIEADVVIGPGCEIGSHTVIKGPTRLGPNNRIHSFASVGDDPQDKKYAGERTVLEIGANNVIREYATVHRGTEQGGGVTRIGDGNLLMAYTHVAHDCVIGDNCILANAASLGGHVVVEDWAILGGFAIVHQFCRIGAHSFSSMGSIIKQDVPTYITADGHPARARGINAEGLKRRGFSDEAIAAIRRAYRILFVSGRPREDALAEADALADEHPEVRALAAFIRGSERGCLR